MKTVWEKAKETDKPVLLYGTGNGADKVLDELYRLGITVSGVFASDGFVRSRTFRSFPVMSFGEAEKKFGDFLVIVSFGSSREDVIQNILTISQSHELYAADVPVVGSEIFNDEYYFAHKEEINAVENMLADDFSKFIYRNIVNFKLSGNINLLSECQTEPSEAFENILKFEKDEIFLDLGAYNGDTVKEFALHSPDYKKIIAVEPDARNFKKLSETAAEMRDATAINACVADKNGEILFSRRGGRNASPDSGGLKTAVLTVDDILAGEKATYIKFDVEGFEKQAIDGARETIKKFKPKMNIACYHRSEDIFSVALQVMKIMPDYKMYLRHFPYIPAWDTQFYFV